MTQEIPRFHVGDTAKALGVTLTYRNEAGTGNETPTLTGKTVKFKMINMATGETKVALTTTGVSVTDAAAAEVQYTFSASAIDEAGQFIAFFVVLDGSNNADTYPVKCRDLLIKIDSDTQTAEEAYSAAVGG